MAALPPDYAVERETDGCWGLRAFIWNFCCPLVKGRPLRRAARRVARHGCASNDRRCGAIHLS